MGKTQIIRCKCGSIVAAAKVPFCYTDSDWQRSVRNLVNKGCEVDYATSEEKWELSRCRCKELERKEKNKLEPDLFDTLPSPEVSTQKCCRDCDAFCECSLGGKDAAKPDDVACKQFDDTCLKQIKNK